jgi:hypothetical protein
VWYRNRYVDTPVYRKESGVSGWNKKEGKKRKKTRKPFKQNAYGSKCSGILSKGMGSLCRVHYEQISSAKSQEK